MTKPTRAPLPVRFLTSVLTAVAALSAGCSAETGGPDSTANPAEIAGGTPGAGGLVTATGGVYVGTGAVQGVGGASGGLGGIANTGGNNPGAGGGGPGGADWCAVTDLLEQHCVKCHGTELRFGAPMPLVTHADMMATLDDGPAYEVALQKVTAEVGFMPPIPYPRLTQEEVDLLQDWVDAGTPNNPSCTGNDGTGGAGPGPDDECIDCGDYSCENGTPIRFLAHGQQTPDDTTPYDVSQIGGPATLGDPNSYQCFYFKAPWAAGTQATGHRPVIDNDRVMHHWLLYGSDQAPPDLADGMIRGDCQLQSDPNRVLLAGWAAGTPGINLPDNVGQELPSGDHAYITLEIHYFNSEPGKPAPDNSGVELCLADQPREHTATQHWLGTENINIPPGAEANAADTCTPALAAGQTSTLLSVTPHMHYLGRHATLELIRANGQAETVLDKAFAFDNQTTYVFDEPITLQAGDRLKATCGFANDTAAPVAFGEGSQEEMCYLFTTAYPAGSLHNGRNGCFLGLCVPGGVRRCIDNENILTALGGL